MIATLVLALSINGLEPPPSRAELCYAHINAFIAEQMNATGRVAGPSWFIRDWWDEKLADGQERDGLRQAAVTEWLTGRQTTEGEAVKAELQACIDEAIEAGALP